MAWSLSYQSVRHPEIVDALLLAAGKSLYLANAFEVKCKGVLTALDIVELIKGDPVLSLEQAINALPKNKMLGGTLQGIIRHGIGVHGAVAELLDKARGARNFIAHEGVGVGEVGRLRVKDVIHRAALLRSAVDDLAAGDNVVSAWCYEIEEKEPAPQAFVVAYPAMVSDWVFGRLDLLLASIDPAADREPTLLELLSSVRRERGL